MRMCQFQGIAVFGDPTGINTLVGDTDAALAMPKKLTVKDKKAKRKLLKKNTNGNQKRKENQNMARI